MERSPTCWPWRCCPWLVKDIVLSPELGPRALSVNTVPPVAHLATVKLLFLPEMITLFASGYGAVAGEVVMVNGRDGAGAGALQTN